MALDSDPQVNVGAWYGWIHISGDPSDALDGFDGVVVDLPRSTLTGISTRIKVSDSFFQGPGEGMIVVGMKDYQQGFAGIGLGQDGQYVYVHRAWNGGEVVVEPLQAFLGNETTEGNRLSVTYDPPFGEMDLYIEDRHVASVRADLWRVFRPFIAHRDPTSRSGSFDIAADFVRVGDLVGDACEGK